MRPGIPPLMRVNCAAGNFEVEGAPVFTVFDPGTGKMRPVRRIEFADGGSDFVAPEPQRPGANATCRDTGRGDPHSGSAVMARDHIPPQYPLSTVASSEVEFKADETWSTYHLADGTVIRCKPVIQWFRRHDGHYDAAGNPVYSQGMLVNFEVTAPPELREK